ncbi:MAG: phosphoribosylamine--glycine ligase [Spirochaetes bacterium]|nr:phosphoribosylamine--glycine ligase [Spirochaetota bacterium]
MKIFVFGAGGREHALCRKLKESNKKNIIYSYPSNGGIDCIKENIKFDSIDEALKFIIDNRIDLVVIGPEQYLVDGLVDILEENKIKVFGPKKKYTKLESSKNFAKEFMIKYNIPTSSYKVFFDENELKKNIDLPIVLKYDGLAAGKGVSVCFTEQEVENFCENVFRKKIFGENISVIAEKYLEGKELSVIIALNSKDYFIFPYSQDHKRAFDNNKGPNTGGMGAIASYDLINKNLEEEIKDKIIFRTLNGLISEGFNYIGFIFFGLMITKDGPFVLEYNVRMGDPETQSIMNLLEGDFAEFLLSLINGNLNEKSIRFQDLFAINVVAASKGYPDNYEKNKLIEGINDFGQNEELLSDGVFIYHAGTIKKDQKFYTNGGRVFSLCKNGEDIFQIRNDIYKSFNKVNFEGMFYRKDIGTYTDFNSF